MKLKISNEFNTLAIVISHDASNVVNMSNADWEKYIDKKEIDKHPETGPINRDLFIEQHKIFRDLLVNSKVKLISPDTQKNTPTQVFTRDPSFVIRDTIFIGSMRDSYRYSEVKGLSNITEHIEHVVNLQASDTIIEGGDIIVLNDGNIVLVGIGQITNDVGYQKLYNHLKIMGIEKIEKIPHSALHLDCCLAPLPDGEALFSTKNLPSSSREILEKYFKKMTPLDKIEDEKFLASNVLWLNPEEVVSNTLTKKTNDYLRSKKYFVHELDFSQPISMWGSFRCATCPLLRED